MYRSGITGPAPRRNGDRDGGGDLVLSEGTAWAIFGTSLCVSAAATAAQIALMKPKFRARWLVNWTPADQFQWSWENFTASQNAS